MSHLADISFGRRSSQPIFWRGTGDRAVTSSAAVSSSTGARTNLSKKLVLVHHVELQKSTISSRTHYPPVVVLHDRFDQVIGSNRSRGPKSEQVGLSPPSLQPLTNSTPNS